jgi:serine/threonine protein kinase
MESRLAADPELTLPRDDLTASFRVSNATGDGQRFRVLRPHAWGGLGAVFVALDGGLHREVALKQILDSHADDEDSRRRFLLEAEITGGLEHPGIVPVYGLDSYSNGRPYYAMRFIRGDSLKDAIERFHKDEALEAALALGRPDILNTDQGSQFTAREYTARLEEDGIAVSRDRRGRALDNVFVERLWRSVKYENIYIKYYEWVSDLESGLAATSGSTTRSVPISPWVIGLRPKSIELGLAVNRGQPMGRVRRLKHPGCRRSGSHCGGQSNLPHPSQERRRGVRPRVAWSSVVLSAPSRKYGFGRAISSNPAGISLQW